jgi:CRISPR-associated protein Csb2
VLAFEVEYLLKRVYAGDFRDRADSEWPPHFARLFSALAAAYFEGGQDAREQKAVQWLEHQGPPHIHAARRGTPSTITAFVPTNYPGDSIPELRGKQPRAFPAQAPAEAIAYFVWPDARPDPDTRAALDELAARTAYLGKACSLVKICLTETAPEPNFVPERSGMRLLRTVAPGRLTELKWLFAADQRPSVGAQHAYRQIDADETTLPPVQTEFGEILTFRRVEGAGLPIEATLTLTEKVRAALMSNAGQSSPIPEVLSGHGSGTHCAIVGLPFTGGQYGDGRLVGFAIVLPRSISVTDRRRVIAAAGRLERNGVNLGKILGNWKVALDMSPAAQTLVPSTWTRASTQWFTVTPILLDRFPKKKGPSVEQVLSAACVRIGLPEPVAIQHSPYSGEKGVSPVPQFRLSREKEERARWGVHAKLTFPMEVRGPVLLGAGRYFGLGLLKPGREEPNYA